MRKVIIRIFPALLWVLPVVIQAAPALSKSGEEARQYLRVTVENVLTSNPEFQSALAKVESVEAQLQGSGLPIHNPELEVEIETAEEDSYRVGISQSLDWYDKQPAQHAVQLIALELAATEKQFLIEKLAAEILDTISGYYTASDITQLHKQRVMLFEKIVKLAEKRLAAGDINKSEVLLARLALADAIIEHAHLGAQMIDAKKTYYKLSQKIIEKESPLLIPLPDRIDDKDIDRFANNHPLEKMALLLVEQSKRQVDSARLERRADPELGLSVGKEGDEQLVALQFSMPWQIRNNFSYTVDVAQKEQVQVELQAQNTHRQLIADIRAAKAQYQLTANAWKLWRSNGESQLKEHMGLLEQLWKNGELSTTDYLVQLEQNLHTQIAGVELKGTVWQAWIEWLKATGQVLGWLNLEKEYIAKGDYQ